MILCPPQMNGRYRKPAVLFRNFTITYTVRYGLCVMSENYTKNGNWYVCMYDPFVRWLGRVIHYVLPLYVLPLSKFHSTPTSIAELPFYNIRGAARKTRSQAYSRIWERAYCRMRFVCIASCHSPNSVIKLLLSIRTVAYVPPPVSEHPNQYSFHLVHSQTQSIASYGAKTVVWQARHPPGRGCLGTRLQRLRL